MRLAVLAQADEEADEAVPWLAELGEELAELDGVDAEPLTGVVPSGAKGVAALAGMLSRVPVTGLTALVQFVRDWAARTGRTVEVSIGGDSIKITGASREQQDRVIEAWLVRNAPCP